MEQTEIYSDKPLHLTHLGSPLVVAGAMLMHENRFLLLKRHPEKSFGDHWNLPAGKVDQGEDPQSGAQRELYEETGIFLTLENLKLIKTFYIKRGNLFIEFHVYKSQLACYPEMNLKLDENTCAKWVTKDEAYDLKLLGGGAEIIEFCLKAF